MEITTMQMYWIVTLNSILTGSAIMCAILGFLIVAIGCYLAEEREASVFTKILASFVVFLFLTTFAACVFIPTTRQMAAIMIVPKIVNSEKVQAVGNRLYDLAVEWMEELKPEKGEDNGSK